MIHPKNLIWAGVLGVVLLGAAVYLGDSRKPAQEAVQPGPLVEGLRARLNDVSGLRVIGAGGKALVSLKREGESWTVVERASYPADVDKLRGFLLKLADAQRIEPKTQRKESFAALGVEDVSEPGAKSLQVVLEGLSPEISLLFGRNPNTGSGTFVRETGEDQTWLIDQDIAVDSALSNWLQRDLVDVAAARIGNLRIALPKVKPMEIVPAASGGVAQFTLVELPRGRELASEVVVDSTAGVFSGLRLDDVAEASAYPMTDESSVTMATLTTREGLQIQARLWDVDGKVWSAWAANLDAARLDAWIKGEQEREINAYQARLAAKQTEVATPAEGDAAKAEATPAAEVESEPLALSNPEQDATTRRQPVEEELRKLQARFQGRVFQLPVFKAEQLRKSLDAYLKPKE
jgi:hypothetical protein